MKETYMLWRLILPHYTFTVSGFMLRFITSHIFLICFRTVEPLEYYRRFLVSKRGYVDVMPFDSIICFKDKVIYTDIEHCYIVQLKQLCQLYKKIQK